MIKQLIRVTYEIYRKKYPQARVIFLAGSMIRGEGTSTSDLDLVVVFGRLSSAYRDSYYFNKWPIEAFVHDPQTLEYFFREVDRPSGFPALPSMVDEGIEIPQSSEFSDRLKRLARTVLHEGPPEWNEQDIANSRYSITDLVEDLKDFRSIHELYATAALLYSTLANHYFRSRNIWSAKGKAIPRRLHSLDPQFAEVFLDSFEELFTRKRIEKVIRLSSDILEASGGFLFDGHRLKAPVSWRSR